MSMHGVRIALGTQRLRSLWLRRIAALFEIIGVFVGGTLLARLAARSMNLGVATIRALEPGVEPDFMRLSWSVGSNLLLRYGVILGLAFSVGWWHRRRSVAAYGVTTAGYPLRTHVGLGLLLFAVGGLLPRLLMFLKDYLPLGRGPQHWELLQDPGSVGFWLYMAVSSYGLVPVVEELFFRGYVQARLAEDFGPPAAILMTALLFAFSHTQYFIASPLGSGMLAAILFSAILGGYVRHRTGSLLPGIVGHAAGNVPLRGLAQPVVLVLMALVIVLWRKVIARRGRELRRDLVVPEAVKTSLPAVVALVIVLAQVLLAPRLLPFTAALALPSALLLELWEKRSNQALHPTGALSR